MTTVEALKNLYVHLGGDAEDVADLTLNPELVDALAELEIGGGGSLKTYYFDVYSGNSGDGTALQPFVLFDDAEFITKATAPAPSEWTNLLLISPSDQGLSNILQVRPTYMACNPTGTSIVQLLAPATTVQDTPAIIFFTFTGGGK